MDSLGGPKTLGGVPFMRVAIVWLVLSIVLLARAIPEITEFSFYDPDDMLRLVQVRDLLAGQGWFDLHQYRIDGPTGTLMHWSRLVDLPLALVVGALTPLIGTVAAEQVAIIGVPLLTLGAILLVVARSASRWLDREGVTLACLCAGLAPLLMMQVQPMRIDHHGWQIFSVMLALSGLARGSQARGAALAGAALAVGLSISMEVLPIAAAFGAVFAFRWLTDGTTKSPLVAFLSAFAGSLALLFLATRGLNDLAQHCDAVSPAHLGFFAVAAVGVVIVASIGPQSRIVLGGLLGTAGIAALGFYLWMAPHCAAGPFGNLDPLVREFWYENVSEGRPAWRLVPELWVPIVAQSMVALLVLVHLWRRASDAARRWWFEYLVVFTATFITGLLVWRSLAFVGALSAIPLGWLAARLLKVLSGTRSVPRKLAVAGVMVLALVPGFPFAVAKAVAPSNELELGPNTAPACRFEDSAATMNSLTPAKVFAPLDLGPALLLRTHHGVVATGHHRASDAMHDVISAFLGTPEAARELVRRHGAEYVLVCTELGETQLYTKKSPTGFAAKLMAGDAPEWLEPVTLDVPPSLRVWRVKSASRDAAD